MVKTLRISFQLKNTYRVNAVIYCIQQIPVIGKWLPDDLYQRLGLKLLAQIVAAIWELLSAFSGKLAFLLLMVFLPAMFFAQAGSDRVFLHIFVLLTLVGAKGNNYIMDADNASYYAISLLGMDARQYILVNYGYQLVKLAVGYVIFGLLFGMLAGVPVWICLLMPLYAAGAKCTVIALSLRHFQRTGLTEYRGVAEKLLTGLVLLLFAAAFALPALSLTLMPWGYGIGMGMFILTGVLSVKKLLTFGDYRALHQQLYSQTVERMADANAAALQDSRKKISDAAGITSSRRGFAYLNELFVKRHRKVLWKPAIQTALGAGALLLSASAMFYFLPELRQEVELDLMSMLPVFPFILYAVNRGTAYTQALFMNCDHSLLTYAFYKQPKMILRLFTIRLRQIVLVNLLPGAVIALGLPLLLFACGGTENPLDYLILFVSVISLNIFFSVHYLTIYYLLQPYNAGSELKNGAYQLVTGLTYGVCYLLIEAELPAMWFGGMCVLFCGAYCVAACVLVYFLAPKTFRICG